jgi:hypothetical protein
MKTTNALRSLGFTVAAMALTAGVSVSQAQLSIHINVGAAPVCPYGYFDYAPYGCAPEGYYGPEWFVRGVFIGAGPWFHGPANFHGHVNNRFDPHHGYHGPMPQRGAHPGSASHGHTNRFRANETRDGRGHTVPERPAKPEQHGH